jgi:hypothetical protein
MTGRANASVPLPGADTVGRNASAGASGASAGLPTAATSGNNVNLVATSLPSTTTTTGGASQVLALGGLSLFSVGALMTLFA